jgi:hypothetical protein
MRIQLPFALLAAVVFTCALHAAPAQAQRVFVSATGSDGNPCTFASPCRSFQHAHDLAPAHGEIDVLDPGGYGAVTITKAISIQGHGFSGITVASAGTGITINAPAAAAVMLNGLIIDGANAGYEGIVFNSGNSLVVNDCLIQNFFFNSSIDTSGAAIFVQPSSGSVQFAITNTIMTNNGGPGVLYLPPSGSTAALTGVLDHVVIANNLSTGIVFNTLNSGGVTTTFSITNSTTSNNNGDGLFLTSATAPMTGSIDNLAASKNAAGIIVEGVAKVTLSRSIVTANFGFGVQDVTSGNTFYTFGNNQVALNGTDGITGLNSATYALH